MDSEVLPFLRETLDESQTPESMPYEYDPDRWATLMEWLKRRACIDLLHYLKGAEPSESDTEKHAAWQFHYDKFKERALGFIKMHDAGIFADPEAAYFVITLLSKVNDFSGRAMSYLKAKPKETLGLAERPPETEVVLLGDRDGF